VAFLGAVAAFLALVIAGLNSQNSQLVRAAYLMMEFAGWFVIVPLCFASLLTGVIQALATPWGMFQHYWILAKLLINVFAAVVLLTYMPTLRFFASLAEATSYGGDASAIRSASPVIHAGAALFLLLAATTLSIYKPPGRVQYGRAPIFNAGPIVGFPSTTETPRWVYVFGLIGLAVTVLFVIGLFGGPGHGPGRHRF
jgi:hypothetical protein